MSLACIAPFDDAVIELMPRVVAYAVAVLPATAALNCSRIVIRAARPQVVAALDPFVSARRHPTTTAQAASTDCGG